MPYLYGNGNPVTFTDPTGLISDPLDWILQFIFSNYFEGIVTADALAKFGGGENWQTQVVIHGARDGGEKDGRADAVSLDSGGLLEFKGVSGLQSEQAQLRTARRQLDDYEAGWSSDAAVVPRCSDHACPGSIGRTQIMAEGQSETICLGDSCKERLTYWQKESGVIFWTYDGNSAKKSMALLRAYQAFLARDKKKQKVLQPTKGTDTIVIDDPRPRPKPPSPQPVPQPMPIPNLGFF